MRVHPSKNMSFKIVYRREFDRIDTSGKLICRNNKCENLVKYPFKKYCSKNCNIEFEKWYYDNFYWRRVRYKIFRRDKYTCQLCGTKYQYRSGRRNRGPASLECDHIKPKSQYEQHGYKFDTLENKIKATIEFFHNHDNLRTLCKECHKKVTKQFLKGRFKNQPNKID